LCCRHKQPEQKANCDVYQYRYGNYSKQIVCFAVKVIVLKGRECPFGAQRNDKQPGYFKNGAGMPLRVGLFASSPHSYLAPGFPLLSLMRRSGIERNAVEEKSITHWQQQKPSVATAGLKSTAQIKIPFRMNLQEEWIAQ
jgi:hypothetical protein